MNVCRQEQSCHGLDLASTTGPRQVKPTFSAVYDSRLSRRREAFSIVSSCFADAIVSAGEMGPNSLFRPKIQSASLSLGLLMIVSHVSHSLKAPKRVLAAGYVQHSC